MKLSNMKVDHKRSEEGEWVKNIPEMEDLELRVRGQSCVSARVMRNKLLRGLPAKVRNDPNGLPIEVLDRMEATICVDVLLLEWRHLDDIPYSKEKAAELLNDPDLATFREAISWAANRVGRQEAAAKEAELGNSGTISAGT
jgi:hypothetical protein